MADVDLRYRIHRLLKQEPQLLSMLERDAVGMPTEPDGNALKLAFREGVRWRAAYWLSMYREVEDERKQDA